MTDPGMADVTYVEPLTVQSLTDIIEKERPDALLPNLGGQTGLNLSSQLSRNGVLAQYGVRIIGVEAEAIEKGEDRIVFKETMKRLGIDMPKSAPAFNVEEAEKVASEARLSRGHPPAYTMAAPVAASSITSRTPGRRQPGLSASMVGQILIEESVLAGGARAGGRPRRQDQMITVCFIENVDAMGVHTRRFLLRGADADDRSEAPGEIAGILLPHRRGHRRDRRTNIQFAHDPRPDASSSSRSTRARRARPPWRRSHGVSHRARFGQARRRG